MKTASTKFHAALLGGLCALAATSAIAADEPGDKAALVTPASTVELKVGDVSDSSFKYGEYNGLRKDGSFLDGTLDLRGGGAYDSSDTTRWRVRAWDLGLPTAGAQVEYGRQGSFRLSAGFDTIRHYAPNGDSYQSPYLGLGGNDLTLPPTWKVPLVPRLSGSSPNARGLSSDVTSANGLVAGVPTAPTSAQLATAAAIQAADLPAFAKFALQTARYRYDAGLNASFKSKWEFTVNARREDRVGAKAMGTISAASGGDISATIPDPINQRTDQFTAQAAWHNNKRDFVQFGMYASDFTNNITSVTWQNWALPTSFATMSSAPSNRSLQFNAAGGHDFGLHTRLTATTSYTRNTQGQAFLTDPFTPYVPASQLDGLVDTTNLSLKLTSRPLQALTVNAGFRYDFRDNQTGVRSYAFYDANGQPSGTNINSAFAAALGVAPGLLSNNANINANRAYSRKFTAWNLDAEARLSAAHALNAGVEYNWIDRFCKGSWIACADANSTQETTAKLEWRANWSGALRSRLSAERGDRRVDAYNENAFLALVPMADVSPTGATGGASAYSYMVANGLTGYGPVLGWAATTGNANLFFPLNNALANALYANGNRISELIGMRRYNMANRVRDRARGELDWQAGEKLALQAGIDWRRDDYSDSRYGLVGETDKAFNLEAEYTPGETVSLVVYYTHERQSQDARGNTYTANSNTAAVAGFTAISGGCYPTLQQRNNNNKLDPCLDWGSAMATTSNVAGATLNLKGLLASHKLDLAFEGLLSRGVSSNDVTGGNYANNPLAVAGAPAGTFAAFYIPATALPDIYANSWELRLRARYAISARQSLKAAFLHAHYESQDYGYDGMQYGGLSGVLPTLQLAPKYSLNVFSLGYSARF